MDDDVQNIFEFDLLQAPLSQLMMECVHRRDRWRLHSMLVRPDPRVLELSTTLLRGCSSLVGLQLNEIIRNFHQAFLLADAIRSNAHLEELSLRDCSMGHAGAVVLARSLMDCDKLKSLLLGYTPLPYPAVKSLCNSLEQMEKLELLGIGLGSHGAKYLAASLHHASRLYYIDLSKNPISDVAAEELVRALENVGCLQNLNLSETGAAASTARAIEQYLSSGRCNVKFLSLISCYLDQSACEALTRGLAASSTMQRLRVVDSVCSFEGLRSLLGAQSTRFTKLRILWEFDRVVIEEAGEDFPVDVPPRPRNMCALLWRRAVEAHRDANYIHQAAFHGRPLEMVKRIRLGYLAGGLTQQRTVRTAHETFRCGPVIAACVGYNFECVRLLVEAGQCLREALPLWPAGERAKFANGSERYPAAWVEICAKACTYSKELAKESQALLRAWACIVADGLDADFELCLTAVQELQSAHRRVSKWKYKVEDMQTSGYTDPSLLQDSIRLWSDSFDSGADVWEQRYASGSESGSRSLMDEEYQAAAVAEELEVLDLQKHPMAETMAKHYDRWKKLRQLHLRYQAAADSLKRAHADAFQKFQSLTHAIAGLRDSVIALSSKARPGSDGGAVHDATSLAAYLPDSSFRKAVRGVVESVCDWSKIDREPLAAELIPFWTTVCEYWAVHSWVLPEGGLEAVPTLRNLTVKELMVHKTD